VTTTQTERPPLLTWRDRIMLSVTVVAAVAAGALHYAHVNAVLAFIVSALALATLASLVGRSVEALGDRLGPNATESCRRHWEICPNYSSSCSRSRRACSTW